MSLTADQPKCLTTKREKRPMKQRVLHRSIKSQEESLGIAGFDLFLRCFSHGQLSGELCTLESNGGFLDCGYNSPEQGWGGRQPLITSGCSRKKQVEGNRIARTQKEYKQKHRKSRGLEVGQIALDFGFRIYNKCVLGKVI